MRPDDDGDPGGQVGVFRGPTATTATTAASDPTGTATSNGTATTTLATITTTQLDKCILDYLRNVSTFK